MIKDFMVIPFCLAEAGRLGLGLIGTEIGGKNDPPAVATSKGPDFQDAPPAVSELAHVVKRSPPSVIVLNGRVRVTGTTSISPEADREDVSGGGVFSGVKGSLIPNSNSAELGLLFGCVCGDVRVHKPPFGAGFD